jgi:NAD(P)-dependent dehydrogenase (short-subunit alcohol dehydrogenase family)
VVAAVKKNGGKAVALKLDVASVKSFDDFAAQVSRTLAENFSQQTFDYLVNNAGIAQRTLIKDLTEEQFDELVDVHFKEKLTTCRPPTGGEPHSGLPYPGQPAQCTACLVRIALFAAAPSSALHAHDVQSPMAWQRFRGVASIRYTLPKTVCSADTRAS